MTRLCLISLAAVASLAACGDKKTAPPPAAAKTAAEPANFGDRKATSAKPFNVATVASFEDPWALAFLPDRRMLVTEKAGKLWLVSPNGAKTSIAGVPQVHHDGQGGLLFVATSPDFATDGRVYLTFSEPGEGGDGLALARATLDAASPKPALTGVEVIWRQLPRGKGGQFGGYIAFAPDGQHLFLASGDRMRMTPAQDPNQAVGKILRLTLDGKPAPGNPGAGKIGATTIDVIDPPENTGAAPAAPKRQIKLVAPNLVPAETWTTGHRNQYGLAFDAQGRLWETEMGPKGGDELNLIEPGKNYGWPLVSYGSNYDETPIPNPSTRPDLAKPALYWNPVIAPAGFAFYNGNMFPEWRGSALIGGMAATALIRVAFDGTEAEEVDRFDMGARIRAVMTAPDGAVWLLEDGPGGRLLRLTSKRAG